MPGQRSALTLSDCCAQSLLGYGRGMDADIAAAALVFVIGGGTYWLMMRWMRGRGVRTPRALPPDKRRKVWFYMTLGLVIAAVSGWAFTSGHAAIGIALLVAVYVLPEFVLMPLRIRRSRQAAQAARARREGTAPPQR